jgi:hypothetical protein|tara:strand:+ start:2886 stop:3674 length:789 start_codon:yes stop_codon:yes gene_type:complete
MKFTISVSVLSFLMILSGVTGITLYNLGSLTIGEANSFMIEAPITEGVNIYTLVEIDEGDNDEEDVVTERLHRFEFSTSATNGIITWDFGDGLVATGPQVEHEYAKPGVYHITATSTTSKSIRIDSINVTVTFEGSVVSDNMECVCTPTAKATIVNLVPLEGVITIEGIVTVEHDGSSESCSLRNPLQECHIRVILERTLDGSIVGQETLFDNTFRVNIYNIPFAIIETDVSKGESFQLRLETDQLRDWHKPTTLWTMDAPL